MRFRILGKILVISLAIAMIGGTTMIWVAAAAGKTGRYTVEGSKAIVTENEIKIEKKMIPNRNPAHKIDIQLYYSNREMKPPILRYKYEHQQTHAQLKLSGYTHAATASFRQIIGNPPARADPEPRGPL